MRGTVRNLRQVLSCRRGFRRCDALVRGTVRVVEGRCSDNVALRRTTDRLCMSRRCLDSRFGGRAKCGFARAIEGCEVRGVGRLLEAAGCGVGRVTKLINCSSPGCVDGIFGRRRKVLPARCEHGSGKVSWLKMVSCYL